MSKYSNKNCVWLTKKKKIYNILKKRGYKCYLNYSLKGLYFGFRAKWHIFNYSTNDTSNFSSMGANHLNLWTGFQIKKLSKFKEKNFFLINCFVNLLSKDRYFLYPDISHFKNIEKHYKKGHYKLLETNFPKQIIYKKKNSHFLLVKEKKILRNINNIKGKVIGYFPTWREDGSEFNQFYENKSSLLRLNNLLKKNKSFVVIKQHSTSHENNYDFLNKADLSQFIFLDYDFDLNIILKRCDLIVSDFSGIIFDYLYFDKQIILSLNDVTKYTKRPGLTIDYDKFNIGYKIYNFNQFYNKIKNFLELKLIDKYKAKRIIYKKKIYKENKNFVKDIIKTLNEA